MRQDVPIEDCKMATMSNGRFAICPRCKSITAKNACGYNSCLFGCGYEFYDKETVEGVNSVGSASGE